MLRIGIDASAITKDQPTGVEIATTELLQAISQHATEDEFFFYTPAPLPASFAASHIHERLLPPRRRWTQTALGPAANTDQLDFFWSPSYLPPLNLKAKSIVTIHGLEFYKYPQSYTFKNWLLSTLTVFLAKLKSHHIFAVSHQLKNELVKYFRISPDKITVIYNAVSPRLQHKILVAAKKPSSPYILAVSRIEPRKNTHRLIEALGILAPTHPNLRLLLAGNISQAGYGALIHDTINRLKLASRVQLLGHVDQAELGGLYKNASVIASVSLDEGFGIPVLEAFAAEVPVVATSTSAAAEVAGEAALLVDALDPRAIADGIDRLLSNEQLAADLVHRGRLRLGDFSWEKSAQAVITAIHSL